MQSPKDAATVSAQEMQKHTRPLSVVARGTNTFRARVLLHQRSVGMHEMTLSVQLTECSRCTEDRSHCIRPTDFSWKRPGCHAKI